MSGVNLLTSSRLRSWQSCPRAHHYRYELGLEPVGPTPHALAFGTAIHKGLEAWWRCYQEGDAKYALAVALTDAEQGYESDDPFTTAMLRALLIAYDARWSEWACTVEVLGVEVPFSYELRHPVTHQVARTWRIAGKMDFLARLSDGRIAIGEHKSTASDAGAGSDYRRRLTLDAQVSTYFDGAASLGFDADLCIYDVLCKPQVKPLLATPEEDREYTQEKSRVCKECSRKGSAKNPTTPPPHDTGNGLTCVDGRIITDAGGRLHACQRERDETATEYEARLIQALASDPDRYLIHAEIIRTEAERTNHAWTLWHTVRSIHEARVAVEKSGDIRAIPQHAHACFGHGTGCQFLPICEGTASAEDTHRYRRLPTVHPELAEVAAPSPSTSPEPATFDVTEFLARPVADSPMESVRARIAEIELPGEAVAVWLKHRMEVAAWDRFDREFIWRELCARTEEVGRMKNAKVWLKKAIAEEDARRNCGGKSDHTAA